jgi:chromosome segregation ATPase
VDTLQLAKDFWPFLVVLGGGVLGALKWWSSDRQARTKLVADDRADVRQDAAAERKDKAELFRLVQEAAADLLHEAREENDRLRKRLDDLESKLDRLREEYHEMMVSKDGQIALLEGEKRQLEARIHSYEDLLTRHNIPIPVQSQQYWKMEDGKLKPAAEARP